MSAAADGLAHDPPRTPGGGGGGRERVLFVTSNGTGLGHLTRSMAIARRLPEDLEPLVLTLSTAAPVVHDQGFPVEYVASYGTPGAGSVWRWSRRLRGRLRAVIAEARPRVLVFDGAHPYQGLVEALAAGRGTHRVWSRRAMWRPGTGRAALARSRFFDRVLEPGELAAGEDRGPTVARREEAHRVAPIVLVDPGDLAPRPEAEHALGLEPGRVNVLVQLGQGPEVGAATERCLRHLAGLPGVQVAALQSAIASLEHAVPDGVVQLRSTYPMSRYYAAFDAAVSAAGYNAYHELIRLRVPALYVPMSRETDDQPARARGAERAGIGLAVEGPEAPEIERRLDELLDPDGRQAIAARLRELEVGDGAAEAAAFLVELAATERTGGPGLTRWQRWRRHPLRSAREAAPFAARLPVNLASLGWQTLTAPPPPRTVALAFGVGTAELEPELERALARTPDPPERVLVVTDSLDFGPLRAAGVGIEHVPGPGTRQAKLAAEAATPAPAGNGAGEWEAFARRRVELILAERRRPRRALAIGDAAEALLEAVRTH
jgi:UDP:flavonoid glycosyltransferase YjiC (YdhE family)